jgi:zinc finger protein
MGEPGPMYVNISADADSITKVESLCMNCHENGETMIMMTRIPFFKEMIVMSFHCPHCGFRNNEVQSGGKVELNGVRVIAIVDGSRDLNRQVVKSEHCTVKIPELDFEIPPQTQKGTLSTIEGLVMKASADLKMTAEMNKERNPEWAAQVKSFCEEKLEKIVERKFNLILDDPSGYSTIENLHLPYPDPKLEIRHYGRTKEQDQALGFYSEEDKADVFGTAPNPEELKGQGVDLTNEVVEFNERCISCNAPVVCRMKLVQIPFFKEITLMAVNCENCGYRSNEVKAGGGISDKGKRHELKVRTKEDLARDILKSETANIQIPELEWDIGMGCISGKFTTVEGLLTDLRTDLIDKNPFSSGDSAVHEGRKERYDAFRQRINDILELKTECTLILDDPAGNSYILSLCAPEPDPQLFEEEYERTWEQNEDLGINDMNTENYENVGAASPPKRQKLENVVEEKETDEAMAS